jgi:thiol:disulfide interchange protein DsbA
MSQKPEAETAPKATAVVEPAGPATITANGVTLTTGKEFELTGQPGIKEGKSHVAEVFNFKCPHCYHAHEDISQWAEKNKADVGFRIIPVFWGKQTDLPLRAFYAGERLGKTHAMKTVIFKAQFEDKLNIENEKELAFIMEDIGLDPKEVATLMKDPSIETAVKDGMAWADRHGVKRTPTLVVNGRYRTNLTMAGETWADVFKVVETLLAYDKAKAGGK